MQVVYHEPYFAWHPDLEPRAARIGLTNVGAFINTNIILGAPSYSYSIVDPQNPILIIQAFILSGH